MQAKLSLLGRLTLLKTQRMAYCVADAVKIRGWGLCKSEPHAEESEMLPEENNNPPKPEAASLSDKGFVGFVGFAGFRGL